MDFKKIAMLYSGVVTAAVIGFFGGKITTENRLVEQHRLELDAARGRTEVLADTITRARTEVGAIGESLSRQRTSVADLRELIGEVRTRYEKMEELLSGVGRNDGDVRDNDSGTDNACEGKVSDE